MRYVLLGLMALSFSCTSRKAPVLKVLNEDVDSNDVRRVDIVSHRGKAVFMSKHQCSSDTCCNNQVYWYPITDAELDSLKVWCSVNKKRGIKKKIIPKSEKLDLLHDKPYIVIDAPDTSTAGWYWNPDTLKLENKIQK